MASYDAYPHNGLTGIGLEEKAYVETRPAPNPSGTAYYAASSPYALAAATRPHAQASVASFVGGMDGSVDSIHLQHRNLAMPPAEDFFHTSFDDLVVWDGNV
ncbi:hypothetical protein MCOR31_009172 [Pyricularia oryzae]|nr:hypothetical protein MCOR31_009172 [Pyricularia oryzae]